MRAVIRFDFVFYGQLADCRYRLVVADNNTLQQPFVSEMFTERYLCATVGEYLALFQARRPLLQLLLQRAQGSSLEHFRRCYTLRATLLVKDWFRDVKRRHPEVNTAVSDFFIRMHCVWMFALFEEMLCDDAVTARFEQVIGEYVRFEIVGWRDIMQI